MGETKPIRYTVDEIKRKRFPEPLFTTVIKRTVNNDEVRKYFERNGRLPKHVYPIGVVNERKD